MSRSDHSGKDLGFTMLLSLKEQDSLTLMRKKHMSKRLKKCMNECKHMIKEYTDTGYYACQPATHVYGWHEREGGNIV